MVLEQKINDDGKSIYIEKGCDKYRRFNWFFAVRKIMNNSIINYKILEEETFMNKMSDILKDHL